MSFTLIQQATPRLHRSELAVPGSNPSLFEKAAKGGADIIFLDLEDAVAPDDKEQARKNIIQGLNGIDWGAKTMMIRINGLDTHYMYRDVVDVVEQAEQAADRWTLIRPDGYVGWVGAPEEFPAWAAAYFGPRPDPKRDGPVGRASAPGFGRQGEVATT